VPPPTEAELQRLSLRADDSSEEYLSYVSAIGDDDLETHTNWRFPNHRLQNVSPEQSRNSPGKWLVGGRIYWPSSSRLNNR
jgi:hypothetical protein